MSYRIPWVRALKKIARFIVWILLIVIIVRFLFFDIFNIPSDSMKNTLKRNDQIITNKVLYSSPLSGLLAALNIKALPDTNDILVFEINKTDPTLYVKRCIGLPGKMIEINDGKVLINKKVIPDLPGIFSLIQHS